MPEELAQYSMETILAEHKEGATDLWLEKLIKDLCQNVGRCGS